MFFKKKEIEKELESVVIVFNIADHESAIAAVMAATIMRERTALEIEIVDVRDIVPTAADKYIYLSCGNKEEFLEYADGMVRSGISDAVQVANHIAAKAVFVNTTRRSAEPQTAQDSVIYKLHELLMEMGIASSDGSDGGVFYRYALGSVNWTSSVTDQASVVGYHNALEACYAYYNGDDFLFEMFSKMVEASEESIAIYKRTQRDRNRVIAKRTGLTSVNGKVVQHLTTTGPEVYGIIRRILLSKQNYLHVSEGRYGRIIFSSIGVPKILIKERAVFNITPE